MFRVWLIYPVLAVLAALGRFWNIHGPNPQGVQLMYHDVEREYTSSPAEHSAPIRHLTVCEPWRTRHTTLSTWMDIN
ncbi:hypothetical protein DPMN_129013 [Dreissena polymorpha]|uniref:Secreted protein n=1 Tax=Dreissena polymorpha TaxID=45954 RepID=A0A9D4H4Z5_DREPO|nr:hypothetical protein DPMN_129013 [Dreissena polymorpha]